MWHMFCKVVYSRLQHKSLCSSGQSTEACGFEFHTCNGLNNFLNVFPFSFTDSPAQIKINGSKTAAAVFLSSSPKMLSPPGRADDLATILQVIDGARKFVYVSVMDYFPTTLHTKPRT